jgi:hypothetical protein
MARHIVAAGVLVVAFCASGVSGAARSSGSCSIRGLGVASVRVVGLRVEGMSCTSARKIASKIASDLAHHRSISFPGSVSFGMAQQSCTGCRTTTSISVAYPHGKVTVSLRGGGGGTLPAPSFGATGGGA